MPARVPAGLEGWLNLPPLSPDFFVPRCSLSSPLVPLSPNFFVPGGSQSSPLPPLSPNFFVPKGSPALLCLLCPRTSLSPNFFVPDLLCPRTFLSPKAPRAFQCLFCPRTSLFPNIFVPELICPRTSLSPKALYPRSTLTVKPVFRPVCCNSTPDLPRLLNQYLRDLPQVYPDCQTCFSACVP